MKRNKLWKRIAVVLLAGCTVMGCLTDCGNTAAETQAKDSAVSESSENVESSLTEEVKESEEVIPEVADLTYWCAILNSATLLNDLGEMPMMQEAMEKNYVNIEFFHPSTNLTEAFNLKLSSGDFEDIVEYKWSSYAGGPAQAIADGVIIDLAPYIKEGLAPNFKKVLDENPEIAKQVTTDEGQIFCFPAIGEKSVNVTSGYYFRQDMLEKVNMEAPTTIDEWEAVLTAFKDELGVEKPLSGTAANFIGTSSWIAGAFDTYSGYYIRDGKVQYGFLDESYKDYIATINKWYEAGIIDAEIFGNDSSIVNSNLLNDRSAVGFGYIGSAIGTLTNSAAETNPDFKLVGVQYPVLEKGDEPKFINRSWDVRTDHAAAITTACENVEAAIRFLDFWYSEEGSLMKNFGTEGVSYEMIDGYPTYTDLILKNPDGYSISDALGGYTRAANPSVGLIDVRYYEQYYQLEEQVEAMYTWNEYADNAISVLMPSVTPTSDESEELAVIENAVKTYVEEELTKFIMGLRNMEEWDSFIETVKGMNVERAIEIRQGAYDRYMARQFVGLRVSLDTLNFYKYVLKRLGVRYEKVVKIKKGYI